MPLALSSGGDFAPFIRYMASTSSWQMSDNGTTKDFDFGQAICDLANIKTGWGLMGEGQAPQWSWDDDINHPNMVKPGEGEWKRGMSVTFYSPKMFGEEDPVRELASTGTGVKMGIEALYAEYEAAESANPGKVPVIKYDGATRAKVGKGNTSVPKLTIVNWVDRPDAMSGDGSVDAAPAPADAPSSAGDDEDEFA